MAEESGLDDRASRVLTENDRLKIWERLLEPGGSDPHGHDLDWLLVQVAGDRIIGLFE